MLALSSSLYGKIKQVTLREQLELRERQWAAFHRWEAEQPLPERDPGDIVADLGAIWDWLPSEVRTEDPDPEKLGIQKMRAAPPSCEPTIRRVRSRGGTPE